MVERLAIIVGLRITRHPSRDLLFTGVKPAQDTLAFVAHIVLFQEVGDKVGGVWRGATQNLEDDLDQAGMATGEILNNRRIASANGLPAVSLR